MIDVVPTSHHIETWKSIGILTLGGAGDQFDHASGFWHHDYLWRELRINQDDIGADRAYLGYALPDCRVVVVERIAANARIGAERPKHEVRLSCDHIRIKALEHIVNFFAPNPAVKHGDRPVREALRQLDRKPAWKACRRGTGT